MVKKIYKSKGPVQKNVRPVSISSIRDKTKDINIQEIVIKCKDCLSEGKDHEALTFANQFFPYATTNKVSTDNLDFFAEIFALNGEYEKALECYKEGLKRDRISVDAAFRMLALGELNGMPQPSDVESAISIFQSFLTKNDPGNNSIIPNQVEEIRLAIISAMALRIDLYLTTPISQNGNNIIVDIPSAENIAKIMNNIAINIEASINNTIPQDTKEKRMTSLIETSVANAAIYLVKEDFNNLLNFNKKALDIMEKFGLIIHKNENLEENENDDKNEDVIETSPSVNQPKNSTLISLSRCLCGSEMYEEAAAVIELALRTDPENPNLMHELAWCYNCMNDYEEAARILEEAKQIYQREGASQDLIKDIDEKIIALNKN